jgi:hypothetical protein
LLKPLHQIGVSRKVPLKFGRLVVMQEYQGALASSLTNLRLDSNVLAPSSGDKFPTCLAEVRIQIAFGS